MTEKNWQNMRVFSILAHAPGGALEHTIPLSHGLDCEIWTMGLFPSA